MLTIEPDAFVPGAYTVSVDGRPQSHVNLTDPTELFFDYVRRMGNVIDVVREPGRPITAVHLGGGGLTLPRYIQATRPGSTQYVVEQRDGIIDAVLERLPLPDGSRVRVITGDASDARALLPAGLLGAVDVVVSDTYSGYPVGAELRSAAYYRQFPPLLAERGVLLVNVPVDAGGVATAEQTATLTEVFPNVLALAEARMWRYRTEGNAVFAASGSPIATDQLNALRVAGPHPGLVVEPRAEPV